MSETSSSLEQNIREVRRHMEMRHGSEVSVTPEHVHEFVGERIQQIQQEQSVWPSPHEDTPSYLEDHIAPKAQELKDVALQKNLETAIRDAVNTHNPAIVKAFHDLITDELFQQLVDADKLEKLAA